MTSNIKLICFDLNHTLIKEDSWRDLNRAMGLSRQEDAFLYNLYRDGTIEFYEWVDLLTRIYIKRGATLAGIKKAIYSYTYKPGAKQAIEYLRQQGYHIVLLSGAMDLVVERVAKELGIKHAASNTIFVFDNQGKLEKAVVSGDDAMSKLAQLELFCRRLGISLTECACVGDGANDNKLFEATRHGITFKGSELEHMAWKTIDKLADIKEIL